MAQTINLNIIPKGIPDVVNVSQYDIGRTIQFNLYEGAQIYTIPAGATAVIGGKKGDTNIFTYDAAISEDRHTVTAITTEQMTAIAGENLCQLRINSVDAEIATINFRMFVQERPDVGDIESVSEIPAIIELARQQQYNAEAWAKGTKNGIDVTSDDPQYHNHAKYWADDARQTAIGGIKYRGSILFANIPLTSMDNGDMYNITDAFTTDNRFKEGSGIYCEAGTNIIWNDAESLWDLAGGLGGVQSFNGRHGNIMPAANDYSYSQISDTPTLGTAAAKNVPTSGDASTTEVVLGNDSRLSDARNAADVYSWAKAASKPDYTASEVGASKIDAGFGHTSDITYNPDTKTATCSKDTASFNSQIYSKSGYKDNVFVTFKFQQTDVPIMVGLSSNPLGSAGYSDIDYCFYGQSDGALRIYEGGVAQPVLPAGHTTYAVGDELRIEYSGGYVRYYHNGEIVRTVARAIGNPLYLDSSFYSSGSIYDVEFGPGLGICSENITLIIGSDYTSNPIYERAVCKNGVVEICLVLTLSGSTVKTFTNVFAIPATFAPKNLTAVIAYDASNDRPMTGYINDQGICVIYREQNDLITNIRIHAIYTL